MEKLVFVTTDFDRIDKRRWPKYITDFLAEPSVSSLHRFGNSKIYYKRFNTDSYPRLLCFEEIDNEGNVLYVPRRYFHDHEEYDAFRDMEIDTQIQRCKYSLLENEEIERKFAELTEQMPKPVLSIEMRDVEGVRDFSNTATTYVFEMEEWSKHLKSKAFKEDKEKIFNAIQDIVIGKNYPEPDAKGWVVLNFTEQKYIICRVHNRGGHTYIYFFDIVMSPNTNKLRKKYLDLSDDRLLKQARKGYPDWILYGEFAEWERLMIDEEANLALSDEEVTVLNDTKYPYFINGLAGSGKSTILYYLFAHAYSYKSVRPMDLIFLSYSRSLIHKAQLVIKALLKTNPSYHGFELTKDEESKLESCFSSFIKFVINAFVTTEEEIDRFMPSKHMTYEVFQNVYETCNLNEARKYKAAMVWSVIRTFIKGRDHNSYFDADSYKELHKDDRTVEPQDYENIYKIWKNWYFAKYSNCYWDDLDLVRLALKKMQEGFEYKKYDIIYCDETQDFTPIENRMILKLSKYSDYDLKGYSQIPIAYAGDPNQTVSPTGFSWSRMKEIFDNSFAEQVGKHIKLQEKTLNNNYRSKRTIVEFANSLQYIRKCFLTKDVLKPQEQWNPQANPLPGFFNLDVEEERNLIQAGFEKTECIITGGEGEHELLSVVKEQGEVENTDNDDLLKDVRSNKLYTAISSKGLEFKAVILYRFADYLPKCFNKILCNEKIENESDKYELSHFFTKIYIAVSRAKEVLYIADTQENYEKFWRHFIDNEYVNTLISLRNDGLEWKGKVGGIEIGQKSEYLHRLAENFNPIATATMIYEEARQGHSAKSMYRAAGYYEEGGDMSKKEECMAYALLYERQYQKAGDKFMYLNMHEEATKAYWQGMCWESLEIQDKHDLSYVAARFMLDKMKLHDFMMSKEVTTGIKYEDATWKQVVIRVGNKAKKIDTQHFSDASDFLNCLVAKGFVFLNPKIAELYFNNGKYASAIDKWDELKMTSHKMYYAAKEETCDTTSEKIYWMNMGGKNDAILKNYSDPQLARVLKFDDRARRIIFNLLLKDSNFSDAMAYPLSSDVKLPLLYRADRVWFVENIVLPDFSEAMFVEWVAIPLHIDDSNIFTNALPVSFFEKVFSLPNTDDWMLFMLLKDNSNVRVMKYGININNVADAISKTLCVSNYVSLAFCFIDVVFNNDMFNYANANKYAEAIIRIFQKNELFKMDFIPGILRSNYFNSIGITKEEMSEIQYRLNQFTIRRLASYKKVAANDTSDIMTLCRIREKTSPWIFNEKRGKHSYPYQQVVDSYNSMKTNKIFSKELIKFFAVRSLIVTAQNKDRYSFRLLRQILTKKKFSFDDMFETFDKEDAMWFIKFVLGRQSFSVEKIGNLSLDIARLMYKYDIRLREYDNRTKNLIRKNATLMVDAAVNKLLAVKRIDIPALKLLTYTWEVIGINHESIAMKYEELAINKRFEHMLRLADYLRQRALHHYAYVNEELYYEKCEEFGKTYSVNKARLMGKPKIE